MIRINLLPQKREARRASEGNQNWLLVVLGVVLLEVVVLIFVQKAKQDELKRVVSVNQKIDAQINDIKRQISNHNEIKSQLKDLRDREEAIKKLQSARTGPTETLLELAKMLTIGRGPTVDNDKLEQLKRDNLGAVPNQGWDSRRMWLNSYAETDRKVRIIGHARDGEDVSEFVRRLTLSDYFYEVKLLPAVKTFDKDSHVDLLKFELSAKVRY